MDIKKILQDAAADQIASKFNLSDDKVSSIISTIAGAVSGDKSNMGSQIVSDLMANDDLKKNVAEQIKDMVLPLILESLGGETGKKLSGLLGKFKL
jgi:hypothetical protein